MAVGAIRSTPVETAPPQSSVGAVPRLDTGTAAAPVSPDAPGAGAALAAQIQGKGAGLSTVA